MLLDFQVTERADRKLGANARSGRSARTWRSLQVGQSCALTHPGSGMVSLTRRSVKSRSEPDTPLMYREEAHGCR
jgi:hypothetical protein